MKWSFAKAGRALPRTSRAMATVGTPVKKADLQPGDLVFFYKPISHVGIYIGNGKIVHASRKGQPVKISDMARMRFTKAVASLNVCFPSRARVGPAAAPAHVAGAGEDRWTGDRWSW